MYKDPTAFRERFKKWKETGEYDLPRFEDGYEAFFNTLPENQKRGPYPTRRYWELNGKPKDFAEAVGKGMYTVLNDNGTLNWHAGSIAYNENTDQYEFMKANYHPTRWMELVYGYDQSPEFLKDWKVLYNGPMLSDRYVRREKPGLKVKGGQLPRFAMGTEGRMAYSRLNGNPIKFDEQGNLVDLVTGETGTMLLPEIRVSPKRYDAYHSTYDPNVIRNFTDYATNVANRARDLGKYAYNYFKSGILGNTDVFIDLSNSNVARITDKNAVNSILFNDFVENNNNTVRKKKDFVNSNDTLLGDNKIPISKISTFYGIEDGKLKAGSIDSFNDETIIIPNRVKNVGKVKHISLPWYDNLGPIKIYPAKNKQNKSFVVTEFGDTIDIPRLNAAPKIAFADESGNAAFVSGIQNKNNLDKLNKFLSKNPSYPIMVDNGRYSFYENGNDLFGYIGLGNPKNMFIVGTKTK